MKTQYAIVISRTNKIGFGQGVDVLRKKGESYRVRVLDGSNRLETIHQDEFVFAARMYEYPFCNEAVEMAEAFDQKKIADRRMTMPSISG